MKIQDIVFFLVFAGLLCIRRPKGLVYAGLLSLVLAIPFFTTWTFFTGERLTWYAVAFFVTFIIISFKDPHKVQ